MDLMNLAVLSNLNDSKKLHSPKERRKMMRGIQEVIRAQGEAAFSVATDVKLQG